MDLDLDALEKKLAEYDPEAEKCRARIERKVSSVPDILMEGESEEDYTFTTLEHCCRPKGHEGPCRNSRALLGWPGRAVLKQLIHEARELELTRASLTIPEVYAGMVNHALVEELERAKARASRLPEALELLRELEWSVISDWGDEFRPPGPPGCPMCGRYEKEGHREGCSLGGFLAREGG